MATWLLSELSNLLDADAEKIAMSIHAATDEIGMPS
jgi:hypothetical protein